jgi:RNA polymerase sigma-70 factor (ECF subfamily)
MILTLYHLEGMSYTEISQVTGLPISTVKSDLFRARKYLKEQLISKYKKEELVP